MLLILGYPFQSYLGVETTLYTGLLIEMGGRIVPPLNYLLSAGVIAGALYFQHPNPILGFKAIGIELSVVSAHDLISFGFYLVLIAFFASITSRMLQKANESELEVKQLRTSVDQLAAANISFQRYADKVDEIATQKERERITREIHDSSGYVYTNLIALIEVALSIGKRNIDRLMEILFEAKEQAREGLKETRIALRKLRKTEERKLYGIQELIKVLKTFQQVTGTEIKLELGNSRWSYGEVIDLTVYRVIQEALTNSIRHGQATKVWIYFWEMDSLLKLLFRDNGKGAEKIEKGIGLSGMEERLSRLGGTLQPVNSNEGFQLIIEIPTKEIIET